MSTHAFSQGAYHSTNTWCQRASLIRLLCAVIGLLSRGQILAQVIFLDPQGTNPNGGFGVPAGLYDTDGDGFGDVLVGVYQENTGNPPVTTGAAYIFSGRDGSVSRTLVSPVRTPLGDFAFATAGLRNLANPLQGDALIGAYGERRVYRFDGASGTLLGTLVPLSGAGGFGASVAVATNPTTGVDDFIVVGAPLANSQRGRVYVFDTATGAQRFSLDSPQPQTTSALGFYITTVPDLNDDTIADILIGDPSFRHNQPPPTITGQAYLFSGADGTLIRIIQSPLQPPLFFGSSVAGIPDLDGDGLGDYAIGAPFQNSQGTEYAGEVYVFSGHSGALLYTIRTPHPPIVLDND